MAGSTDTILAKLGGAQALCADKYPDDVAPLDAPQLKMTPDMGDELAKMLQSTCPNQYSPME